MSIKSAITGAADALAQQIKPDPDSLTHSALMPIYEQVLDLIDSYSTDPKIDAVCNRIRSVLGIPMPTRPTYPQPNEEETNA